MGRDPRIPGDGVDDSGVIDNYVKAILNVLEDAGAERDQLNDNQRALLNILNDFADEQHADSNSKRAIINILEDFASEKISIISTHDAVLNILEDAADERTHLADAQRAALNILDDVEVEKMKVESANLDLRNEIAERERMELRLRTANAATARANAELEAFSYSVAHDLRAPLRSIDGFSLALIEDCADVLDEQGLTYLTYVRESAQQMAALIDDLLSLARLSQSDVRRSTIDLVVIAQSVHAQLRKSDPDRTVTLVVPEALPAFGDPALVKIVFDNLIGNAWKFTRHVPAARIEIGIARKGRGNAFFVRDNGAGFSMEYAGKLFTPFQRLHGKSEFEGTGIGLALVQRIVNRHGGRISGEGTVGEGATFYFTLEEDA